MDSRQFQVRGFTLIELIGVMAIVAIMASVIAPRMFDDLKRARRDKETTSLANLGSLLRDYILDTKHIPAPSVSSWTTALASVANLPTSRIEFNDRGFRRGYYVDPRFFTTSDTNFSGYTQQGGLVNPPVSARIMLVSVMTGNAPAAPNNSATFDAIWNQTSAATLIEGPDIKIERVNMQTSFHRVILTNGLGSQVSYQLENGSSYAVPAASGGMDGMATRYVLARTRVNLFDQPFPGGQLARVLIADSDKAYAYRDDGAGWTWATP
ncbi:MAG: type II secretion system protein [Gammaproteobacteria bacterium]|nr:type II secretion system protein [Gammaproteobacteria bacterium]